MTDAECEALLDVIAWDVGSVLWLSPEWREWMLWGSPRALRDPVRLRVARVTVEDCLSVSRSALSDHCA